MRKLALIVLLVLFINAMFSWAQDGNNASKKYVELQYLTHTPEEFIKFIRDHIAPHIERDKDGLPTKDIFIRAINDMNFLLIASTAPSDRRVLETTSGMPMIHSFIIVDDIVVFIDPRTEFGVFMGCFKNAKMYGTFDADSVDLNFNSEVWIIKHNYQKNGRPQIFTVMDHKNLDFNYEHTNINTHESAYRPFSAHVYDSLPQTHILPVVSITDVQLSNILADLTASLTDDNAINPEEYDIYIRIDELHVMFYGIYKEHRMTIDFENTKHIPFGDVAGTSTVNGFHCFFDQPAVNLFTTVSNEYESVSFDPRDREESLPQSYIFFVKIMNFDCPRDQMELKLIDSKVVQKSCEQTNRIFYTNPINEFAEIR